MTFSVVCFCSKLLLKLDLNILLTLNLIQWRVSKQNKQTKKKEHPVKRARSSVILTTRCTYIGLGARGWGGTVCWGAPAICSASQASNKSPSMQAGQPARPFPERGRGAETEGWRLLCVCVCVCVCAQACVYVFCWRRRWSLWQPLDKPMELFFFFSPCDHLIKIHMEV